MVNKQGDQMSLATQQTANLEQNTTPTLKLISNQVSSTAGQKCLAEIREKLSSKTRNPAYIYNKTLTVKQRKILCFSAGLTRTDLQTPFEQLNEEARLAIQKAILLCGHLFETFNQAQALEAKQYIKCK